MGRVEGWCQDGSTVLKKHMGEWEEGREGERVKGRKNDRRFIDPPKPRAYNFFF